MRQFLLVGWSSQLNSSQQKKIKKSKLMRKIYEKKK